MDSGKTKRLLIALAIAFALNFTLIASSEVYYRAHDDIVNWVPIWVSFGIYITLTLANILGTVFLHKYYHKMSMQNYRDLLLERRSSAEDDLARVTRHMKILSVAAVSGVALTFFSGAALIFFAMPTPMVLTGFLPFITMTYLIYRGVLLIQKANFDDYTNPSDYPVLHELAASARDMFGLRGEIRIYLVNQSNCGIAKVGKRYSIFLGVQLLDILSKEELLQVFIHEFAHESAAYTPQLPTKLSAFFDKDEEKWIAGCADGAYGLWQYLFMREYTLFLMTASQFVEAGADRAVRELGDIRLAGEQLCKLDMYVQFDAEVDHGQWIGKEPFYKAETVRAQIATVYAKSFREAFAERRDFWRSMMEKEIQGRMSTHPIVRTRLEALGLKLSDVECRLPDDAGSAYRAECDKAISKVDELLSKQLADGYAERREEYYLKPLAVITEYEQGGGNCPAEQIRPIIQAYGQLCRYEEQEALCDKILAETENVFATAYAHLIKGQLLTWKYDNAGIDEIWRAIDLNDNNIDAGLDLIGEYCCRMGLEERLEEFRSRSVELAQKQVDTSEHAGELTAADRLVKETFPDDRLPTMLSYMEEVGAGHIREIYLVRKIITDDFFSSVFVVRMDDDTEPKIIDKVMDTIFNYLDNWPEDWQYSLFFYNDEYGKILKKVEGSLVFRRAE